MTTPKHDPSFGDPNVKIPEIPKLPMSWRSTEFAAVILGSIATGIYSSGIIPEGYLPLVSGLVLALSRVWSKFNPKTTK